MNPREFRDLASKLADKEDATAADLRTAASRAYYALFNVAVNLLSKMGVKHAGSWESHRLVPEAFRYSGDESISRVAREMVDIRKQRWAADYDMVDDTIEDQRTVQKIVARAKQAIKRIDECQANPARFMEVRIRIRNWAGSAEGAGKGFSLS